MKFPFWEIQAATSDFSKENLLGEGEFGHVYKGLLKDGHVIAARLRKEASSQSQGYTEFFYEVHCPVPKYRHACCLCTVLRPAGWS